MSAEDAQAQIAEWFSMGEATLRRWLRRARETGSVAPITDYPHGAQPGRPSTHTCLSLKSLCRSPPTPRTQRWRSELFPTPTPRRIPASKQRHDHRERRATRAVAVVGGDHALTVYAPERSRASFSL